MVKCYLEEMHWSMPHCRKNTLSQKQGVNNFRDNQISFLQHILSYMEATFMCVVDIEVLRFAIYTLSLNQHALFLLVQVGTQCVNTPWSSCTNLSAHVEKSRNRSEVGIRCGDYELRDSTGNYVSSISHNHAACKEQTTGVYVSCFWEHTWWYSNDCYLYIVE